MQTNPEEKSSKKEPKRQNADHPLLGLIFNKHYLITCRLFSVIIATVAILGGGGYLLDNQLQTKPLFLIIGLIIAFPVSLIIIVKTTKNLINKTLNGSKHS